MAGALGAIAGYDEWGNPIEDQGTAPAPAQDGSVYGPSPYGDSPFQGSPYAEMGQVDTAAQGGYGASGGYPDLASQGGGQEDQGYGGYPQPSAAANEDAGVDEGDYLGGLSRALLPKDPGEVAGALDRYRTESQSARARQLELIQNASRRISEAGQPSKDAALLAWANQLMMPAATSGEGYARANQARAQEEARQQGIERLRAAALGDLDLAQGTAGVQGAAADYGGYKDQIGWGLDAAKARETINQRRQQQEELNAERLRQEQSRKDTLAENERYHQDLVDQRREADERGRYTWQPGLGPDPKDPNKQVPGIWKLPTRGDEEPTFSAEGTITNKTSAGPGGKKTDAEMRYERYVDLHKDDPSKTDTQIKQEALEFSAGRRKMSPSDAQLAGYKGAVAESLYASPPWTQAQIDARAKAIAESLLKAGESSENTQQNPGFRTNFPLPSQSSLPVIDRKNAVGVIAAPPMDQRTPGRVYQTPKGPMTWTGTGWRPQ